MLALEITRQGPMFKSLWICRFAHPNQSYVLCGRQPRFRLKSNAYPLTNRVAPTDVGALLSAVSKTDNLEFIRYAFLGVRGRPFEL